MLIVRSAFFYFLIQCQFDLPLLTGNHAGDIMSETDISSIQFKL